MKIMLSFSYRAELITQKRSHILQAAVPEEAFYREDIEKLDKYFLTNFDNRISDMMKALSDPDLKPDVLIMTATRDDLCEEEARLISEIEQKGIKVIGHSYENCQLFRDKRKTKKFLQSIGIPVPTLYSIDTIQRDCLPVVVKYPCYWEGKDMSIDSDMADLPKYCGSEVMIEKYISGIEMSVQVVRYGNKSIVSPPVYKGPTSLEMIHPLKKLRIFPNPWHAEKLNKRIMEMAIRLADASQAKGPLDIDLVAVNEEEFYVLEVNSRLSGVSRMICSAGHNVMDMLISMADGTWEHFSVSDPGVSAEIPVYCKKDVLEKHRQLFDYIYIREDINTGQARNRILLSGNQYSDLIHKITPIKDELKITEDDWQTLLTIIN